jgi:integrase
MTIQNTQSGTEVAQRNGTAAVRHVGKTHVDYWKPRVYKRSYQHSGKSIEIPDYYVRIAHLGRREEFPLKTPNMDAAARKARDIYNALVRDGWQTAIDTYKPDMVVSKDGCTVGEFLEQVGAVGGLNRGTFEIYAKKFRSLVADICGIDGGDAKHDYVNGGHQKWLQNVHAVKLEKLTPEVVKKWKIQKLNCANPLEQKRAQITARSILLSSKALFSKKRLGDLTVKLPSPLPFDGVELPPEVKNRYRSEIDPALLWTAARRELVEGYQGDGLPPNPRPEQFKILLLALGAGLRRDEIDKLEWKRVLWSKNTILVETTEHGATKTDASEGEVDVDPGLLAMLKAYRPKPDEGSAFVIESDVAPRPQSVRHHHYRCNRHFRELVKWLHGKGIRARNALHSLRKEYGSQICKIAGIYAASTALRHSNITITRNTYVEKKQPIFLPLETLTKSLPAA